MPSPYEDPEHWRERADEARATASYVRDPEVKAAMHRIADEYDQLARLADGAGLLGDAAPAAPIRETPK
jgi:hypothetical protein